MTIASPIARPIARPIASPLDGSGGGGLLVELLINPELAGYSAGNPGTPPTGWDHPYTGGSFADPLLTLGCVVDKKVIGQTLALDVGSYAFQCDITLNSGSAIIADLMTHPLPITACMTATYYVDGVAAVYTDTFSGSHTVKIVYEVASGGNLTLQLGVGCLSSKTQNVTISNPTMKKIM